MKRLNLILLATLVLAGCTTTDEIIIDEKGVDMVAYEKDLAECRSYGSKVKTSEKAARGVASGAVVGGLTGAIFGGSSGAATGAGAGAVGGGLKGADEGERTEVDVVRRCISGRGYHLLN
jgi:outer membrane lipoprotein SlyB